MAVGSIDLKRVLRFDLNGIHIEKPRLVGGRGKENIPGVEIGMEDPVLATLVKQLADGGKSAGAGGGGGASGKK